MMKISHAFPPLCHGHINMLGHYTFTLAELVTKGHQRPLKEASEAENVAYVGLRSTERQTPYKVTNPISQISRPQWYVVIQLSHSQFCQPVIDSCIKGFQFVVGKIVFVFSITFSSVFLEVQRLRRNSHSCLVM
jgi:hypothetical protein